MTRAGLSDGCGGGHPGDAAHRVGERPEPADAVLARGLEIRADQAELAGPLIDPGEQGVMLGDHRVLASGGGGRTQRDPLPGPGLRVPLGGFGQSGRKYTTAPTAYPVYA